MKKVLLPFLLIYSLTSFGQVTKSLAVFGSSTAACYPQDPGSGNYTGCWLGDLLYHYNGHTSVQVTPVDVFAGTGTPPANTYTTTIYNSLPMSTTPNPGIVTAPSTGYSYDLSPNALRSVDNILPPLRAVVPDVVIINYPSSGYEYMSLSDVMSYFQTISNLITNEQTLQGKTPAVYIATPQPRNDFVASGDLQKLIDIRDAILTTYGSFALDFWTPLANPDGTLNPAYDNGNGVIPNTAGHELLWQQILAADIFGFNAIILPVKIKSFDAVLKNSTATLKWVADEESPGTKYVIEKSTDGTHFSPIAEVKGLEQASGNKYSYIDPSPVLSGAAYYRIQVVEYTGSYFSAIRKLSISFGAFVATHVFPNPASTELNVEIQSNQGQSVRIDILSALGQTVQSSNKAVGEGQNFINIPITKLSSGMYFIKIVSSSADTYIQKFIKN